ncbi:unnamed protein product [Aspergillus niger]|uniref:Contig An08c0170, genomic contig n=1 Tax=Aspergillus niger (strain ATCC MYA-4892 / CBS 513.88 / FGSC A1513) TaxID=425011 RepID=A2QRX1_ASPNC|nr:unnamed protein product [Aspergillus niger]
MCREENVYSSTSYPFTFRGL